MKINKIITVLESLMFAGVASAAAPTVVFADKTKQFGCENEETTLEIKYDMLTYGNGNGNKVVITKGIKKISGPGVGFPQSSIKTVGFDTVLGLPNPTGTIVVDIVNGNNTGDYEDETAYTQCIIPQLN